METRIAWGLIFAIIGVILTFIPGFFENKNLLFIWVYSLPIFVIGIIILFNKKEDKIEQINYNQKKGGKK
jgi:membrane protein DedA with SNARE-associated domain